MRTTLAIVIKKSRNTFIIQIIIRASNFGLMIKIKRFMTQKKFILLNQFGKGFDDYLWIIFVVDDHGARVQCVAQSYT